MLAGRLKLCRLRKIPLFSMPDLPYGTSCKCADLPGGQGQIVFFPNGPWISQDGVRLGYISPLLLLLLYIYF